MKPLSVIVPTFRREDVLVDSLQALARQLRAGDELIVVDQTPQHEPPTSATLERLAASGVIRWLRRSRASQNEAMNLAALIASHETLVFLDDDIVPGETLLDAYRELFANGESPAAACGQVLQPWDAAPVDDVEDFDLGFTPAYSRACDARFLIGANFAIRKSVYLAVGGMDENFTGANYRNDTELAYRVWAATQGSIRFEPAAALRHLFAGGGNRAFGAKDTWGHIGGSIGDYYFALKWLPARQLLPYIFRRLVRATFNRNTVTHPWLVPSMALREIVAFASAARRLLMRPHRGVRALAAYDYEEPFAGRAA